MTKAASLQPGEDAMMSETGQMGQWEFVDNIR
jgi:hypothetical protein